MLPRIYCCYVLAVSLCSFVPAARADEWDPQDDTGSTAPLLTLSEAIQTHGPHTLDSADTNDWFRVELTAGIPCQFESSGLLDTEAFLYSDSAGTLEVASDDQGGDEDNFRLDYLPTVSGPYYLKVREFVAGAGGSYTLQYGYYAADAWDPADDTGTNGTVITMGEAAKIHGPHALDPYDHNDWFRVNLSSGMVYRFETTGPVDTDTWGGIYTDTFDPSDEAADDYNDDGPYDYNFQLDYTPPDSGEFYLKVRAFNQEDYTEYNLHYYIPANDSDGDQLPDSWELQYFGDLSAEPTGASDSDSLNNFDEYVAGTNPTNADSFFAVTNWSTGSFVVGWPSVSGRQYRVLWAESLTNSFEYTGPVIDYPQNSYTDTLHNAYDSGFYKVEVQLK